MGEEWPVGHGWLRAYHAAAILELLRVYGTLEIRRMSDPAPERPALLADLEHRQEDVLRQLDALNRRIEQAVSQCRLRVKTTNTELRARLDV
jgi:type VI protein secretion system component VasK